MIDEKKKAGIAGAMQAAGFDFALFIDREGSRNPDVPYLCGHPSDAALLLSAAGDMTLFPWDPLLAKKYARGAEIVDPRKKGLLDSISAAIASSAGREGFTLALPSNTAYFTVESLSKKLEGARIACRPDGIDRILEEARAVKTASELTVMEKGFAIADEVLDLLPAWLKSQRGRNPREIDLAFFLQREMFERGTDGAREAMLVANPDRSGEVHQHPQAGFGPLCKPGLALIDFWMQYEGYYTDVTVPILFEPLTAAQEEMVETVLQVYDEAMKALAPGASIGGIAGRAIEALESRGMKPVGSLGHGIGLAGHDAPRLSAPPKDEIARKMWKDTLLAEGMVLAVEPGVVHEIHGGFRLENDVIIRAGGAEIMTHAVPIRVKA